MFKFITTGSRYVHNLYDIATLEDVALGVLDDEKEAERVATIAGNMEFNDLFLAKNWSLTCLAEE